MFVYQKHDTTLLRAYQPLPSLCYKYEMRLWREGGERGPILIYCLHLLNTY